MDEDLAGCPQCPSHHLCTSRKISGRHPRILPQRRHRSPANPLRRPHVAGAGIFPPIPRIRHRPRSLPLQRRDHVDRFALDGRADGYAARQNRRRPGRRVRSQQCRVGRLDRGRCRAIRRDCRSKIAGIGAIERTESSAAAENQEFTADGYSSFRSRHRKRFPRDVAICHPALTSRCSSRLSSSKAPRLSPESPPCRSSPN